MDNVSTIEKLQVNFPGMIENLRNSFPIETEYGNIKSVRRDSNAKIDKEIASKICQQNSSPGWAHLMMKEPKSDVWFQPEIMICTPGAVKCTGVVKYNQEQEYSLRMKEMSIKEKRTGRRKVSRLGGDLPSDIQPRKLFLS
jgi:hypothetical protein